MLNINTLTAREAWCLIPNNSVACTNDSNGNATQIRYYTNNELQFLQNLTYDSKNAMLTCECVLPESESETENENENE